MDMDDDALRLLSAEEREALQGEYDEEAENAAALAGVIAPASEHGEAGDGESADATTAASADATTQAEQADAGAALTGDEPAPAAKAESAPAREAIHSPYAAQLPTDFDTQVAALKSERKAARDKFNSGDLDSEEYEAECERLDEERLRLSGLKQRAEIAAEMHQQAEQKAWVDAIKKFNATTAMSPEHGVVDYGKSAKYRADFDQFMQALGKAEPDQSIEWYLTESHKRVVALHGIPTKAAPQSTKRAAPVAAIPPGLADTPGGAAQDAHQDEFDRIDRLTGPDAERALARLSPEQMDQYLRRV